MKLSIALLAIFGGLAGSAAQGSAAQSPYGPQRTMMARYPAIYRPANPAHSPDLQASHKANNKRRDEPVTNTEAKFADVLKNVQKRNRAKKCEGLDIENTFLGRMHKFLSYWETDDYAGRNKTEHDLLIRVVEYQAVYQTMVDQSLQDAFPDDIVDQVRSVHKLATEDGALVGETPVSSTRWTSSWMMYALRRVKPRCLGAFRKSSTSF
ncbi:hypothetical protein PG990_014634 [Apiospora arundinis]